MAYPKLNPQVSVAQSTMTSQPNPKAQALNRKMNSTPTNMAPVQAFGPYRAQIKR